MIYKPSKLVVPELAYNKLVPNNIKHELNPPNKKYIKPPVVDSSEFLYIVLNIYSPQLCSSIDRKIDTKSLVDIKKLAPIITNNIING